MTTYVKVAALECAPAVSQQLVLLSPSLRVLSSSSTSKHGAAVIRQPLKESIFPCPHAEGEDSIFLEISLKYLVLERSFFVKTFEMFVFILKFIFSLFSGFSLVPLETYFFY